MSDATMLGNGITAPSKIDPVVVSCSPRAAQVVSSRPIKIPLESMIPQRIDNLLIGGKSIAVTHIVNAATRVHNSEWSIGAAAGVTAAWLLTQPDLTPADIVPQQRMAQLQQTMKIVKTGAQSEFRLHGDGSQRFRESVCQEYRVERRDHG